MSPMRRLASTALALLVATACKKPMDAAASPSATERIVIVDAGSSGTRLHVYEASGEALVDVTPNCTFGPPLASEGPDAVLRLWRSCGVAELIETDTPIRVYATGGMRTLAEADPARAEQIHTDLAAALRELGHVDVESRTIEGEEEARFAWVATNLELGTLGDESVGVLELGGSSTQIAFVPDDPTDATETLELGGRRYPLFAVSYLHCGANEARRELAVNSCFFPACEQSPECAQSLADTPAKRGTGELEICSKAITQGLRSTGVGVQCPVAKRIRPIMATERFVLVDNFASLVRSFGAANPDGTVDLERLWSTAAGACTTAWTELDEPLAAAAPMRRSKACFDAGLTHALFELYGVASSAKLAVLERTPVWALGAAYLER